MERVLPYTDSKIRYGSRYTKSENIAPIINIWERHMLSGKEDTLVDKSIELIKLMFAYSEFYRHYHDLTHLREALSIAEDLCASFEVSKEQTQTTMAAIFFHDVIQHASNSKNSNERLSAQYAADYLGTFTHIDVPSVRKLILGTEGHRDEAEVGKDYDLHSIVNYADLSILATEEERYAKYLQGIKDEYLSFDTEDGGVFRFYTLRKVFIESILAKTRIFNLVLDEKLNHEEAARRNMKIELQVLAEMNAEEEVKKDIDQVSEDLYQATEAFVKASNKDKLVGDKTHLAE